MRLRPPRGSGAQPAYNPIGKQASPWRGSVLECVQRELPLSPASPRQRPAKGPWLRRRAARAGLRTGQGHRNVRGIRISRDQSGS